MKNILALLIFCSFLSISCTGLALEITGITEKKAKLHSFTFNGKKCVFISMHHIGKEEFYYDVKGKVDSLKRENFMVLYEGLKPDTALNKERLKQDLLKFRKITGISIKAYLDSSNSVFGKDLTKWKLVNQPDNYQLGIDSVRDIRAELPFSDLIVKYEEKNGGINLDKCDMETDLSATYNCETAKNGFKKFQEIRNYELARQIAEVDYDKIAVVFGGMHYKEIKKILKSSFKESIR